VCKTLKARLSSIYRRIPGCPRVSNNGVLEKERVDWTHWVGGSKWERGRGPHLFKSQRNLPGKKGRKGGSLVGGRGKGGGQIKKRRSTVKTLERETLTVKGECPNDRGGKGGAACKWNHGRARREEAGSTGVVQLGLRKHKRTNNPQTHPMELGEDEVKQLNTATQSQKRGAIGRNFPDKTVAGE